MVITNNNNKNKKEEEIKQKWQNIYSLINTTTGYISVHCANISTFCRFNIFKKIGKLGIWYCLIDFLVRDNYIWGLLNQYTV